LVLIIMAMALVFASGVSVALTQTGGPGDDTLRGTPDRDHLFGEAGDTIDTQDLDSGGIGERDAVDCGPGLDKITAGCEDTAVGES
jgi:hypothetical protein